MHGPICLLLGFAVSFVDPWVSAAVSVVQSGRASLRVRLSASHRLVLPAALALPEASLLSGPSVGHS